MRMIRGCPATGRMSHSFDKATHRCRCGRWQAGFKPKAAPARPRAECQICEREQATTIDSLLVHHGYKRPGWGCIVGDCMGVGHLPYPATDALKLYRTAVQEHIAGCQSALDGLPNVTSLPFRWAEGHGRSRVEKTTPVVKGGPRPRCGNYCVPDFDDLLERERRRLEQELKFAAADLARVEARIAAAEEAGR